ncbi:MAG TPA: signal peptidase II [Ruminococcaceae bacterium]|jgi:signal peptidase II|nr:signal peptidase II [Oscillospiraceae bacterium]
MFGLFLALGAVVLIVMDQFTKWLAKTYLEGNAPFVLIDGVFELNYLENSGAAFGILSDKRYLLIGITSVALLALFYVLVTRKLGHSKLVTISGTLVLAGGVGNLIDRIFRHKVVDFFYFKAINFAIFNLADCFVVVGASLILFYYLFLYKEKKDLSHAQTPQGAVKEDTAHGAADTESFAGDGGGEA